MKLCHLWHSMEQHSSGKFNRPSTHVVPADPIIVFLLYLSLSEQLRVPPNMLYMQFLADGINWLATGLQTRHNRFRSLRFHVPFDKGTISHPLDLFHGQFMEISIPKALSRHQSLLLCLKTFARLLEVVWLHKKKKTSVAPRVLKCLWLGNRPLYLSTANPGTPGNMAEQVHWMDCVGQCWGYLRCFKGLVWMP